MANDYQRILRAAQAINGLPDPEQQPDTIDPSLWLDPQATNVNVFGVNDPAFPFGPNNFGLLGNVEGHILVPGGANAIFRNLAPPGGFNMPTKCVFTFTCRGKKFSEMWYSPSELTSLTAFGAGEYVSLRLDWSGLETKFLRARYSDVGNRFAVRPFNEQQLRAAGGLVGLNQGRATVPTTSTFEVAHSAFPSVALLTQCTSANRGRRLFLRGFPDRLENDGGEFTPWASWNTAFTIWKNWVMTAPAWGWIGQPSGAPGGNTRYNITAFTNTAGQITVTASGNIFAGLNNQNVPIRIRGLVTPFKFLNGPLTVKAISDTVGGSIRVMPWPAGAPLPNLQSAQVYLQVGPTFYPASSIGVTRVVSRDTGGNPDPSRGRRRNRVWA